MRTFFINELKELNFNYDDIFKDFSIVKFSTSENYIRNGALILDEVSLNKLTKSVIFESGKTFYALFKKGTVDCLTLRKVIDGAKDGDTILFDPLTPKKVSNLPKHILAQLLLNSISTPKHKRLTFNNLTGKLYLFHPDLFKRDKKGSILKVIGLEMKISKDLNFELNVKTFSRLTLFLKENKQRYYECKYTLVDSKGAMRRVLGSDKLEPSDMYILKQEKSKKSTVKFLDFRNYEAFKASKMGMLTTLLKTVKVELSNYLTLDFAAIDFDQTHRYKPPKIRIPDKLELTLIDGICDEDSAQVIATLKNKIEKLDFFSGKDMFRQTTIRISDKEVKNGFNIKLIHNKEHYINYNLPDPYEPSLSIQHVTLEDFKIEEAKPSLIKYIVCQLLLKNDIKIGKVSIINWEAYGFKQAWTFGIKVEKQLHFLKIFPDGRMKFESLEGGILNQNEYHDLCKIFDDEDDKDIEDIELVLEDHLGNIKAIKKTENFTLPPYEKIDQELEEEAKPIQISKSDTVGYISELSKDDRKKEAIISKIKALQTWDKKNLLACFSGTKDPKEFVKLVRQKTGEILKTYFQAAPIRYELFDSQLDIHASTDRSYYVVGTKGEGIRQYMTNASTVRQIQSIDNSKLIFADLLPLMNVDFVKNKDLTVLPFPLKYLREWAKVNKTSSN